MILCESKEGKHVLKIKGELSIIMAEFVNAGGAVYKAMLQHDGEKMARELMEEMFEDILLSEEELEKKIENFYAEHPEFERGEG